MNNPFGDLVDDPRQAAALKAVLEQFSGGASGPEFKDLADDVLQGRSSLREAVLSGGCGAALDARMTQFASWYQQLSDSERLQVAAEAEAQLDQFLAAPQARREPVPEVVEPDEEPPGSYLRDAW